MRHIEEAFYGLAGYLELAAMLEVCKFKGINSVFKYGLTRLDWPFLSK
jgi:hypothetical protein